MSDQAEDIRKKFSLAFDDVDPYARKLVYKTDDQGRTYRDFGDYLYTEDQLQKFMEYMNAEPNLLDTRRSAVRNFMGKGRDPMEAMAMSKAMEMVPVANLPYVADDVYGRARQIRDAYQEERKLDMLGHIAMMGLDVAPSIYGGFKGLQFGRNVLKNDAAKMAKTPMSMRKQPPLSAGILNDYLTGK